eukprot:1096033-Rhodomonas_salina.1
MKRDSPLSRYKHAGVQLISRCSLWPQGRSGHVTSSLSQAHYAVVYGGEVAVYEGGAAVYEGGAAIYEGGASAYGGSATVYGGSADVGGSLSLPPSIPLSLSVQRLE